MARVLILCPTHDHADALFMSLASVRLQTVTDWRMVVICDGSPPRTLEVLEAICAQDDRISFQTFEKGERFGEAYRDGVLRAATEEFVCHLSDDDIWASNHLDSMLRLLDHGDWGAQSQLVCGFRGIPFWTPVNFGTSVVRKGFDNHEFIAGGLNNVAYRREAYLKLPVGWSPAPAHLPSDCFMWAKFLRHPDISVASTTNATALKLPSDQKKARKFTVDDSMAHLGPWLGRVNAPGTLTSLRTEAEFLPFMVGVLTHHRVGHIPSFVEAMAASGLRPVDQYAPTDIRTGPEPIAVPLSDVQRDHWELAHLTLRCFGNEPSASAQEWSVRLGDRLQLARRLILSAGRVRAIDMTRALTAFEEGPGNPRAAAGISATLAIEQNDLLKAEKLITEAEERWPDVHWLRPVRTAYNDALAKRHKDLDA